jgi:hypothetical protein
MKKTRLFGVLCSMMAGIVILIGCGGGSATTGTSINLIGSYDGYRHIDYNLDEGVTKGQLTTPIFNGPRKDEQGVIRIYAEVLDQMNVVIKRWADNTVTIEPKTPAGFMLEGINIVFYSDEPVTVVYTSESSADVVESRGAGLATASVRKSQKLYFTGTEFMAGGSFVPGSRSSGGKLTLYNPPPGLKFNLLLTTMTRETLDNLAAAIKAAPSRR